MNPRQKVPSALRFVSRFHIFVSTTATKIYGQNSVCVIAGLRAKEMYSAMDHITIFGTPDEEKGKDFGLRRGGESVIGECITILSNLDQPFADSLHQVLRLVCHDLGFERATFVDLDLNPIDDSVSTTYCCCGETLVENNQVIDELSPHSISYILERLGGQRYFVFNNDTWIPEFAPVFPDRKSGVVVIPLFIDGGLPSLLCLGLPTTTSGADLRISDALAIAQVMRLSLIARTAQRNVRTITEVSSDGKAKQFGPKASLEGNFAYLFNFAPIPLMITRDGVVLELNRKAEELYRVKRKHALGNSTHRFYANIDDRTALLQRIAHQGALSRDELEMRTFDGKVRWMETSVQPVVLNGEEAWLVAQLDITDRKVAEKKLVESESRFREIVENMVEVVFTMDANNIVTYCSPASIRVLSQDPEHVLGSDFLDQIGADDKLTVISKIEDVRRTKEPAKGVLFRPNSAGNSPFRWFELTLVAVGSPENAGSLLGVILDVTYRVEATARLRESEQLMDSVLNSISSPIFVLQRDDRKINDRKIYMFLSVNAAYCQLTNIPKDKIIGLRTVDLYPDHIVQQWNMNCAQAFEMRAPLTIEERIEILGVVRHYQTTLVPVYDIQGQPDRIVGMLTDLTESKRYEQGLLEAKREVEESNLVLEQRVRERTRDLEIALSAATELNSMRAAFISTISHQFRTPLTVILSSTELLNIHADRLDTAQREESFQAIERAVDSIVMLLEGVRRIGDIEASAVRMSVRRHQADILCDKAIRVAVSATEYAGPYQFLRLARPVNVLADEAYFTEILRQLLSNTKKFVGPTSELVIRLSIDEEKKALILHYSDGGRPIATQERGRIFEPFYRGSDGETTIGAGLGLTICRRYAEQMGGSIIYTSFEGGRSGFALRLPLAD